MESDWKNEVERIFGSDWERCGMEDCPPLLKVNVDLGQRECLRLLAINGFVDPLFELKKAPGATHFRCTVTGPDGERYMAGEVLLRIGQAIATDLYFRDRREAVLDLLRIKQVG